MRYQELKVLEGKTLISCQQGDAAVVFVTDDGTEYVLKHQQECCESVWLEDVCGDLADLVGTPIIMASEEYWSTDGSDGEDIDDASATWSYYKFATIKGSVTVRFYGSSNGYYGETARLYRCG